MRSRRVVLGALVALVASGCGYHLAGSGESVPKGSKTITIRLFQPAP